jgi:dTDP-4-amino-4,6-dideoxy-D-galactose acyltransferase
MEEFRVLDWDTGFFGYKVAELLPVGLRSYSSSGLISLLKKEDIHLAYCFASPDDISLNQHLIEAGAFLADIKITFSRLIDGGIDFTPSPFIQSLPIVEPSKKLRNMALQSGLYSRFKIDPGFQEHEYERLYDEWIYKSVQRMISKEVLIFEKDGDEKGFITLQIKKSVGSIGLIAVDENARGASVGKELVNASFHFFQSHQIASVEVVTQQANQIACNFYKSMGFDIKTIINVYHLWNR